MGFATLDGRPVPAVTADEMRAVDRVAVEDVGLGLLQMMENAGRTLAAHAHDLADGPVVVLAGGGGNGGGGLCAARHLDNHGVPVDVVLDRDSDELHGAARTQFDVLDAAGVTPAGIEAVSTADLVVDAIIGYGLDAAPRGRARDLIAATDGHRVLSLDVPSGVNATTGERPGDAVSPTRTVTLALPKTGLDPTGDLHLVDIGIPPVVYDRLDIAYTPPFDGASSVQLTTE